MKKYCENCGTKLNSNSKFCPNCGLQINEVCEEEFNDEYYGDENKGFKENLVHKNKIINEIDKRKINIVLYIIGAIFMYAGVGIMFNVTFISGFLLILFGMSLLPITYKFIQVDENIIKIFKIALPIIFFILVGFTSGAFEEDSMPKQDISYKTEETKKENDELLINEDNVEVVVEKTFVEKLSETLSPDVAQKVEDILLNQIGFTELEYIEKDANLTIYYVNANDYKIAVTASDDVYQIFVPNGYDFYKDGKVVLTYDTLQKIVIDSSDKVYYYVIAQNIIESVLLSPSSAKFPSDCIVNRYDNIILVKGTVESQNAFGVMIKSEWLVEYYVIDLESFVYEPIYVNFDGEEAGEYIDLSQLSKTE